MGNSTPLPKSDNTTWPWQPASPRLREQEQHWPRISVIIPNYNYGQFLEAALRSVLLQAYENLEVIVIDGGSTDDSLAIIEQYRPWISVAVSEKDDGQSDAINKGIARASGEICTYLNSDDLYAPHALATVGSAFAAEKSLQWLVGKAEIVDSYGIVQGLYEISSKRSRIDFISGLWLPQPATFWRKSLHDELGGFDAALHYIMDQEWWARLSLAGYEPLVIESVLACHREHGGNKTSGVNALAEVRERILVYDKYIPKVSTREARTLAKIKGHKENYVVCKELEESYGTDGGIRNCLNVLRLRPQLFGCRMFWGLLKNALFRKQVEK